VSTGVPSRPALQRRPCLRPARHPGGYASRLSSTGFKHCSDQPADRFSTFRVGTSTDDAHRTLQATMVGRQLLGRQRPRGEFLAVCHLEGDVIKAGAPRVKQIARAARMSHNLRRRSPCAGEAAGSWGVMLRNLKEPRIFTDFWWNLAPLAMVFATLYCLNSLSEWRRRTDLGIRTVRL